MNDHALNRRHEAGISIAREAGALALRHFESFASLKIDRKGHQDLVSEADREVELAVRAALTEAFPDDSIVGEEHAPVEGTSGWTWVIDPIDGTANFVRGIPAWTVVLACVEGGRTRVGIIHDPVHYETHHAREGGGAFLDDAPIRCAPDARLDDGAVGVGFSGRTRPEDVCRLIEGLVAEGGVFLRNASGALSLAYVSSGRLLGYAESHMNAWDCLAGQLLVSEAGGAIEPQDADAMLRDGGRVVVGARGVFPDLVRLADAAFSD
jgi:myo-inositol-1(or 4)-monophosphatase